MALLPGTNLVPYEIVALLGVGGMGEVYRARDRRLGRDVAIKVLPASIAENAQSMALSSVTTLLTLLVGVPVGILLGKSDLPLRRLRSQSVSSSRAAQGSR